MPAQGPQFLGASAGQQRKHDVRGQPRLSGGCHYGYCLIERQRLGGPAFTAGWHVTKQHDVTPYLVPRLGAADAAARDGMQQTQRPGAAFARFISQPLVNVLGGKRAKLTPAQRGHDMRSG